MADINNYSCPACTGTMQFDAKSGKVVCEYCGSAYDVKEVEKMMENSANSTNIDKPDEWTCEAQGWDDPSGMQAYNCPSCGASLVSDDTTITACCPYCGSTSIVPSKVEGGLEPELVIPFKLEKQDALDKLNGFYGKRLLVPEAFKRNTVDEIHGVYVPFWLYDGIASGNARYHAEKKSVRKEGEYEITKTDHYSVYREGSVKFEKIPVDGSSKMDDALMDSIEPYDYKDIKPFSKGYLTGYMADCYDEDSEKCSVRAKKRAENTLENMLTETVKGYDGFKQISSNVHVEQGKVSYAMMPVWLMNTDYNGKTYRFAMNGQTGKMVGEMPMDKMKAFITAIISFVIPFVLMLLIGGGFTAGSSAGYFVKFVAVPLIVAIIAFFGFKGQLNTIHTATTSRQYAVGNGLNLKHKQDNFIRSEETRRKIETNK